MNILQTHVYISGNITVWDLSIYLSSAFTIMICYWCLFWKLISPLGKIKNDWCDRVEFAHQHSKVISSHFTEKSTVLVYVSESPALIECALCKTNCMSCGYTNTISIVFCSMTSKEIHPETERIFCYFSNHMCSWRKQIAGVIDCTLKVG